MQILYKLKIPKIIRFYGHAHFVSTQNSKKKKGKRRRQNKRKPLFKQPKQNSIDHEINQDITTGNKETITKTPETHQPQ